MGFLSISEEQEDSFYFKSVFIMSSTLFISVGENAMFNSLVLPYLPWLFMRDKVGLKKLTFRRVSDLIADMDYNALVMSRIKSHGRYGRTRELNIAFSPTLINRVEDIIKTDLK